MNRHEDVFWLGTGGALWALATLGLATLGGPLFERSSVSYVVTAVAISVAFVLLYWGLARLRRLSGPALLRAAACLSVPGLLGEVPVLLTFPSMVPSFDPTSAGNYAAFLFFGYAALLGAALLLSGQRNRLVGVRAGGTDGEDFRADGPHQRAC